MLITFCAQQIEMLESTLVPSLASSLRPSHESADSTFRRDRVALALSSSFLSCFFETFGQKRMENSTMKGEFFPLTSLSLTRSIIFNNNTKKSLA